jgi:hypothetical protein
VDSTRQLTGQVRWSRSGSSRLQLVPVADPDVVRALDVGQAAYIFRGGVTFTQVKRVVAGPAALPAEPALIPRPAEPVGTPHLAEPAQAEVPARGVTPAAAALPDVTALLDEAFGSWP